MTPGSVDLLRSVPYTEEYGYMECWSAPRCPFYRGVWLYGVLICSVVSLIPRSMAIWSVHWCLVYHEIWLHGESICSATKFNFKKTCFVPGQNIVLDRRTHFVRSNNCTIVKNLWKMFFFIEYSVTPSLYKNSREEKTTAARALWPSTVQYNSSLMQILSRVTQVGQIN